MAENLGSQSKTVKKEQNQKGVQKEQTMRET